MRVIKTPVAYRVTCDSCRAVIEFTKEDVAPGAITITCPNCGRNVKVYDCDFFSDAGKPIGATWLYSGVRPIYAKEKPAEATGEEPSAGFGDKLKQELASIDWVEVLRRLSEEKEKKQ